MGSAVVIGGGVAGILSALLLRRRFRNVTLVEGSDRCGGLFRTSANSQGVPFDQGTHIPSQTGVSDLDEVLFGVLDSSRWNAFRIVRTATFFKGELGEKSAFVDARSLPPALYRQGLEELMKTRPFNPSECRDLDDFSSRRFGPTFTRHIFEPVLEKQLGRKPRDLLPDNPFLPKRLICLDEEGSRRLKKDPFFDDKVAFNSYREGVGERFHFYPRCGGVELWIQSLMEALTNQGVRVELDSTVRTLGASGGRIRKVGLRGGQELDCDHLVWTVPPIVFLRAAGLPGDGARPQSRPIDLLHFVFDQPFPLESDYLTCYDPELLAFRVTFYPNLRSRTSPSAPHNCTVEVVGGEGEQPSALVEKIQDELVQMGALSWRARRLSVDSRRVPFGFPILTPEFSARVDSQVERIESGFENVSLLGRSKCRPFFVGDVLQEVYQQLGQPVSENLGRLAAAG